MDKLQPISAALFYDAKLPACFGDGLFRTYQRTSAAAMAQLVKGQHTFTDNGNRLELTHFRAFTTEIAFVHVHLGYGGGDCSDFFNAGVNEKVCIGCLHITVQKLNIGLKRNGQVCGHSRLARSAFTACHTDNHIYSPELNIKRPAYHPLVYLNLFLLN
jgi:hypothetical protein